ncbi:ATP-binding cassette domain-containing protein [Vibrio sp. SM6]|uniref:Multidrug resistance-like ATP-binding protein MdlA n=1 Tax=Vibrio agarilyticus TaxID=2726741 RepID=A0A7X8TN88_9VIBR|nr:ABC transporter transmembrane domain-containing protein [Vibrio agarilyticus]NLS11870.1 ATP-binding cassette domain-containing protein [Vibrio agarilyticus]
MSILWALRHYIMPYWRRYVWAFLALQLVAILNLLPSWLIGELIDRMSQQTLTSEKIISHVGAMLLAALAMYGLRYVWQSQLYGASIAITKDLRLALFAKFSALSPRFYARRRTGELMAHATSDLDAVEQAVGIGVMTLVDAFIAGVTVIVGMIWVVSGSLTAAALLPFPLLVWATHRYGTQLHRGFAHSQAQYGHLTEEARETVASMRAVRAHGLNTRQTQRFDTALDDTMAANLTVAKLDAAFAPTIQLIYGASLVVSLGLGVWLIAKGELTIGLLTTFTLYLSQLLGPFMQFGWQFNVFQRGRTAWQRLANLFDDDDEITQGTTVLEKHVPSDIAFDIGEFRYTDKSRPALRNVRFTLPKGGFVGVTGPTGGGKSTLLRLALRLHELPLASTISIGGASGETLTLASLRQRMAWVPQKPFLFRGTIAQNIAFANPSVSQSEIEIVARHVGLADEIAAMPQGYDTELQEGGANLSGGQRQRLTLARALMSSADVLLLDDPFSALDQKTAALVFANLTQHYRHKTWLLVSQRLSNLRYADHIVVLECGEIREQGTHEQLIARSDWYASVYQQQMLAAKSKDDVALSASITSTHALEVVFDYSHA